MKYVWTYSIHELYKLLSRKIEKTKVSADGR